ncbi:hypothetical protein TrVE_jg8596 [Triparma verrucosa]|uniref:Uncharacterized protein n=1 Tax=Triparma verrucosa TaxID=1606542 RepID=A0A9W7FG42_9STRA|nr:hypothetical protein TrVE_jg8596 [Triparma verrucosa]
MQAMAQQQPFPIICGFIVESVSSPSTLEVPPITSAPPPLPPLCTDAPPADSGSDPTHVIFKKGGLCRSASCRYCDNTRILTITVEKDVTTIPAGAFWGCTSLTRIDWGDSKVTSVGAYAFQETAFTSLSLPLSLINIEVGSFSSCKYLRSVNFPPSISRISRGAFQATGIKHVVLDGAVEEIGDYAFIHCDELETVEVTAEGVATKIGKGAFAYCSNLRKVTLKCRLSEVGEFAFSDCKNLDEVVWPGVAEGAKIGDKIFQLCVKLHDLAASESQDDILEFLSSKKNKLKELGPTKRGNVDNNNVHDEEGRVKKRSKPL